MTRAIGIDIGSRSIKIAEVDIEGNTRTVVGLTRIPYSDVAQIAGLLKDFFASAQSPGERVAVGLGATPIILRHFQFPFGDRLKVQAAIHGEFEDQLPFEIADQVLDFKLVHKKGRAHEFLAGLCPNEGVARIQNFFEAAGLTLHSLLVDSEALGQLALDQNLPAARNTVPYVVCDIGNSSTKLAIVQGSRPQTFDKKAKADPFGAQILEMRVFNRGARDVVEGLQDLRKIDVNEAESWLYHRAEIKEGAAPETDSSLTDDLSDDLKNALKPILVEIYQTLQAFKNKSGSNLSTLYITGGLTRLKGLRNFLSQELRLPVNPWPLFLGFRTDSIPMGPDQEREFAAALALAHRYSSSKPQGWLNFRRSSQGSKKIITNFINEFKDPILKPAFLGLGAAALCTYIYFFATGFFQSRQEQYVERELVAEFRRLNRELGKSAEVFVKELPRAQSFFEREKTKLSKSRARSQTARAQSDVLLDLSQSIPASVSVKDLSVSQANGTLSLQSRIEVRTTPGARWQEELKSILESKGYSNVSMLKSSQGRFVLKASWKGSAL